MLMAKKYLRVVAACLLICPFSIFAQLKFEQGFQSPPCQKSLKRQKDNLEIKVNREHILLTQMPELAQQILELVQSRGRVTMGELERLTNANRNTLRKNLENLVQTKRLQQNGVGKGTWHSLTIN